MKIPLTVIAQIVLEGMKAWNEHKRTEFKRKYHKILTKLEKAQNATGDDYTDSEIDKLEIELTIFLKAFADEINK